MVINLATRDFFKITYPKKKFPWGMDSDYNAIPNVEIKKEWFNKEHTYCLIFTRDRQHHKQMYNCLFTTPGIKVVYQSKPAVNKADGHGTAPRNFLVIVEYDEPVQAVPEVQSAG